MELFRRICAALGISLVLTLLLLVLYQDDGSQTVPSPIAQATVTTGTVAAPAASVSTP